jgi:hypothetical protein
MNPRGLPVINKRPSTRPNALIGSAWQPPRFMVSSCLPMPVVGGTLVGRPHSILGTMDIISGG